MYVGMEKVIGLTRTALRERGMKSNVYYESRIRDFFDYLDTGLQLDAITYAHINNYINSKNCSPAEKLNIYNALKLLFNYTAKNNLTGVNFSKVGKPRVEKKLNTEFSDADYYKLVDYINDGEKPIKERLLIGLFLYTGLSRKYIAKLTNSSFMPIDDSYRLIIVGVNYEYDEIVLKGELRALISEYMRTVTPETMCYKIFEGSENSISTKLRDIVKEELNIDNGTPTTFSNTFIYKALNGSNDLYAISKLIKEKVKTVAGHITEDDDMDDMLKRQEEVLKSF